MAVRPSDSGESLHEFLLLMKANELTHNLEKVKVNEVVKIENWEW